MATSGSTNFNLTGGDIATFALRKINVLPDGQDMPAEMWVRARNNLNAMLKGWQRHSWLWNLTEGSVALVQGQAAYTPSPAAYNVVSARYRDAGGRDLPMTDMTREEYFDLPDKSSAGIPTQYHFARQSAGTLYLWPTPASVTTETVRLTYQRAFEDIDNPANDLDIRQSHLDVVGFNLAAWLADDYGKSDAAANRTIQRAAMLLQEALDEDREDTVRFIPERRYG